MTEIRVETTEDVMKLVEKIRTSAELALNSAFGTDDRHGQLGIYIAENVVYDTPLPWRISKMFGQFVESDDDLR